MAMEMAMGVLDGKVVLVTGGGNGIGKECALLAAREGANVLVNDIGGSVSGGEGSSGPAETVAAEIRKSGGKAASNSDSVTDMKAVKGMVQQALDEFGALHHVVNPAGILRDAMFHKMEDADWKAVIDVHLHGTYNVCRSAVSHFREQQEGSFVLFSSTSGLIGNIGQANYAAAKMGIAGLSRIIAMEGLPKNVRSNVISPFAWTRMIGTIPVKDEESARRVERMRNLMRADQVATFAIALCAAKDVSGQIFVVRGNEIFLMSQPRPLRGMAKMEGWTPSTVLSHALPAMKPDMYDAGPSASVFSWDPV